MRNCAVSVGVLIARRGWKVPNKTIYKCTCNSIEFDPDCVYHNSKETRIKLTPMMQSDKLRFPEITWQELIEIGLKEYKLLKEREFYNSLNVNNKTCECR